MSELLAWEYLTISLALFCSGSPFVSAQVFYPSQRRLSLLNLLTVT